jgi:hypothetical protein
MLGRSPKLLREPLIGYVDRYLADELATVGILGSYFGGRQRSALLDCDHAVATFSRRWA